MSRDVFKCLYEVPADHPAVTAHFTAVDTAAAATWAYVESVGALGYHTSGWDGSLYGVIFPDLIGRADHWRVLDHVYHPNVPKALLCVPKKTKAAVDVRTAFDAAPKIPKSTKLAKDLGWSGAQPTDGKKVHFATVQQLDAPTPRIFVQVPRQIGDGWTPPDFFTEVLTSEHMAAIAAHNALVPERDDQ